MGHIPQLKELILDVWSGGIVELQNHMAQKFTFIL